jgi:hypothetical protein
VMVNVLVGMTISKQYDWPVQERKVGGRKRKKEEKRGKTVVNIYSSHVYIYVYLCI